MAKEFRIIYNNYNTYRVIVYSNLTFSLFFLIVKKNHKKITNPANSLFSGNFPATALQYGL